MKNPNLARRRHAGRLVIGKKYWVVFVTDERPELCLFLGIRKGTYTFTEIEFPYRYPSASTLDHFAGIFEEMPSWDHLIKTRAWTPDNLGVGPDGKLKLL